MDYRKVKRLFFDFLGKAPDSGTTKLIIGLGNPGREYESTRHNIGMLVAERIGREVHAGAWKNTSYAEWTEQVAGFGTLILAKPKTFMNRSGLAVRKLIANRKIRERENILVITDDADLPFGKIRFREKGSSGGHRGLESIIGELGGSDFPRLRMGIGRTEEASLEKHVLAPFSPEESAGLDTILSLGMEAAMVWAEKGPREVMNRYN